GDVEVCFAILDDGSVYRPYVSSSTHRVFNRSALRAIRSSKFEADPSGERSIKACRKYQFRLQPIQST
ncbi:MAG: TonB family protein, partial [Pseudomonadota bacterium]